MTRFYSLLGSLLLITSLAQFAAADPAQEIRKLQKLQPNDQQVQQIFSLFLSQVPALLNDTQNGERLLSELAPQALNLLNEEQQSLLLELAPQEQLENFGSMTREERTRFLFNSAQSLVHPSKQEWLQRLEEMVESSE